MFGNLQHVPQLLHSPVLFFDTGKTDKTILLNFDEYVFFFLSAITLAFSNT
jgi:hypothetical protein